MDLLKGKSAYVKNVCFEEGVFICNTFAKYTIYNVSWKKSHHKYCKIYPTSTVPSKRKIHRIAEKYKITSSVLDKSEVLKRVFFSVMHGLDLARA